MKKLKVPKEEQFVNMLYNDENMKKLSEEMLLLMNEKLNEKFEENLQ